MIFEIAIAFFYKNHQFVNKYIYLKININIGEIPKNKIIISLIYPLMTSSL